MGGSRVASRGRCDEITVAIKKPWVSAPQLKKMKVRRSAELGYGNG